MCSSSTTYIGMRRWSGNGCLDERRFCKQGQMCVVCVVFAKPKEIIRHSNIFFYAYLSGWSPTEILIGLQYCWLRRIHRFILFKLFRHDLSLTFTRMQRTKMNEKNQGQSGFKHQWAYLSSTVFKIVPVISEEDKSWQRGVLLSKWNHSPFS